MPLTQPAKPTRPADVPIQQLIDSYDWKGSPLGERSTWSPAMSTSFKLCISLQSPCAIYLSKERYMFWNSAYQYMAGDRHPAKWGCPVEEIFPNLPELHSLVKGVFATGVPFGAQNYRALLAVESDSDFMYEGFYDWTLGPITDEKDQVCSVMHVVSEVTNQILMDRRAITLSNLAVRAARGSSVDGVCHAMLGALADDALDLTWMAAYVKNDDEHRHAMDLADKLAGQGRARSLGKHRLSDKRQLYRLVGTTFDQGLVKIRHSTDTDVFATAEDEDDGDDDARLSKRSRDDEERFEEGTSVRELPAWLPPLPGRIKLAPVFTKKRQESVASSMRDSAVESSASGSGTASSAESLRGGEWPFDALSVENPHILLATPTPTSANAETIIMPITTLSPVTGQQRVLGVFVAGLNENRKLDESYLKFLQSVAKQFETAFLNGKAREEDRRSTEALKKLNHDRVQFFQNTAHELRTPLTLMLGPLEELVKVHSTAIEARASAPAPAQTLSRLSLVSRNARRLLKLVNSILRFSSIEAGKLDTRFERQESFGLLTRQLAECFEPLSAQSGVQLVLAQDLQLAGPGADQTVFDKQTREQGKESIFIDVDLWEQVVFNTLSNAFKNTWKGSITVSLYESDEDGQEGFRMDVADTGVGISKEQLGSIFERFFRADNREARSAEGTGIGLSLVRELVRLHGGNISATSELGKGTTFTVWIPRGLNHLPHDRVFSTSDPARAEAETIRTLEGGANRWNNKTRGIERAVILDEVDALVSTKPEDEAASYFPVSAAVEGQERPTALTFGRRPSAKPTASHISHPSAQWSSNEPTTPGVQPGLPMLDPSNRATILVVDDNQDMRYWIGSILQLDYNVVEAINGREALDLLQQRGLTPDLVLSDVNMPLVNGITLVKEVRSDPRINQIPVILISAHSAQEDAIEGLDAGAADYLIKPFNVRDLLARCRVHVRLNRLRLQVRESENELLVEQSRTEAKNSLLGLVSHELRTPLQTIQGAVNLLSRGPNAQHDLIEAISAGAQNLSLRIDQLIDVAQVGSNKFQLAMSTFDLDALLTAALAKHSPVAAANGVGVYSVVGRAPSQVTTDRERLLQVLDVLLANAVKFTTAGEIVVRVWVENADGDELVMHGSESSFLCFSVTDSGAGIAKQLAQTIFEPFSLADSSSTRAHGGAGLGLTLALRLVELAGGQLGVESTLGQGSEFRCRWPIDMDSSSLTPRCGTPSAAAPVIVAVSSSEPVQQSLLCTATSFDWRAVDGVATFDEAEKVLSAHTGHHPLVFFVDDRLVHAQPAQTAAFLANLALVRTAAVVGSGVPGTRSYAVAINLSADSLDHFAFHGVVNPPFHRTHVSAVVSDLLAQHRRPALLGRTTLKAIETVTPAADPAAMDLDTAPHTPLSLGRLMVAEDNKINAKLLIKQLKQLGFAADEAEHGLKVLDLIAAEATPVATSGASPGTPPRAASPYLGILMDLDMPQMDGFEATRRVRAMGGRFSHLPVLAVSANGSPDIRERVAAAGMNDFLSKPVTVAQLTALLERNGLMDVSVGAG